MLVMVVFFIAFRWIPLSAPLIRLFLLVLILLLVPSLHFLAVWFALGLVRFRVPSRLPVLLMLWLVALRLLVVKSDGSMMVHSDAGGYKPENWMTPPTVIEEEPGSMVVRKVGSEDRLDIRLAEVVSDVVHDMGEAAALQKDGVERHLQELLAGAPEWCGEGFRPVRREWPTDIGPVDPMCRDGEGGWGGVESKRGGTISA